MQRSQRVAQLNTRTSSSQPIHTVGAPYISTAHIECSRMPLPSVNACFLCPVDVSQTLTSPRRVLHHTSPSPAFNMCTIMSLSWTESATGDTLNPPPQKVAL